MLNHLNSSSHTKLAKRTISLQQYWQAIHQCNITNTQIRPPTGTPPPVFGLPVHKGYRCSECSRCASSIHSLKQHMCIQPSYNYTPTHMQRFNISITRAWFPVQAPHNMNEDNATLNTQLQQVLTDFQSLDYAQTSVDDARKLSPWLMTTKWHVYTAGLELGLARKVVAIEGGDKDYPSLHAMLRAYITTAESSIDTLNTLVLQRLNTDDPQVRLVLFSI